MDYQAVGHCDVVRSVTPSCLDAPGHGFCIKKKMEMEEKFYDSLLFFHVPGVINKIVDKFSLGEVYMTVVMLRERCGMEPRPVQLGSAWDVRLEGVLKVVATMKNSEGV